ncbi:DUF1176 domain-containing protein [Halomonas sp. HMF6819]|uniref:DUF1176 domain-containing protein n=1 Tax=Halomonas sp. HMF6819 TaxID=3373085 RepID=UPI0037AC1C2F
MKLRTLSGWVVVALGVGTVNAQEPLDEANVLPDDIAAMVSDTCAPPVDDGRRLSPAHYAVEGDTSGDLWLAVCIAGAYQTSYEAIYQAEDTAPRKLLFAQWRNGSWTGTDLLYNPSYDPHTGVLTDQYKDRGAGGCGGERTWQWENGDFRLIEYRAAEACSEENLELPIIFEAE